MFDILLVNCIPYIFLLYFFFVLLSLPHMVFAFLQFRSKFPNFLTTAIFYDCSLGTCFPGLILIGMLNFQAEINDITPLMNRGCGININIVA